MVNTFLPWPDYTDTAKALDSKRLGKQRVEALQILRANLGLTQGWRNHPAAVMWRGSELQLIWYTRAICSEWVRRGYVDNVLNQIYDLHAEHSDYLNQAITIPWWIGDHEFHESHQSNLKRKNPEHYRFDVEDDLPYKWPTPGGVLRIAGRK
jgi:hypothetical protein